MNIVLLLVTIAPFCYAIYWNIRQWRDNPGRPLPTSDTFHPHTGFPGLDTALESYHADPTAVNEAEVVFQTECAEGAIECCFPE